MSHLFEDHQLNTIFYVPKYYIPVPHNSDRSDIVQRLNDIGIEISKLVIYKGRFWIKVEYPCGWKLLERNCSTKVYNPCSKGEFLTVYYRPVHNVLKKYKPDWKELCGLKIGSCGPLIEYDAKERIQLF